MIPTIASEFHVVFSGFICLRLRNFWLNETFGFFLFSRTHLVWFVYYLLGVTLRDDDKIMQPDNKFNQKDIFINVYLSLSLLLNV